MILPIVICVFGNLALTMVWQIVDPHRYVSVDIEDGPVDEFGRYLQASYKCESEKT